HEMYAREHDDLGLCLRGRTSEGQGVADDIGHTVIDLGRLIIMRQHDRVTLALELENRRHVRREERPLHRGNDALHLGVDLAEAAGKDGDVAGPRSERGKLHSTLLEYKWCQKIRRFAPSLMLGMSIT